MSRSTRRAIGYIALSFAVVVIYALAYQWVQGVFEGREISFLRAFEFTVQSFTTTGYGEESSAWTHPASLIMVILMMVTGVFLIFLTLPLFVVPLVESALARDPPSSVDLEDHVVICTFTPRGQTLVDELRSRDKPYVVVEDDREYARELYEDGYSVIHGDAEDVEDLDAANVQEADTLVADDTDERNASIVLSAKQAAPDVRVITVVEDPNVADYHRYAGADATISPRRLLGERLAGKATTSVSSALDDAIEISEDLEIAELLVQRGSPLEGKRVLDSGVGEMTGTNIIGAWFRGEFKSPPSPDDIIDEHTILLVAGREEQLEELKALTLSETRRHGRGKVIVAGDGEVGETAAEALAQENAPHVVVDKEDKEGVDVVGDVTERETLERAGIDEARSIILALDTDTTTIFASLVAKQVAPHVEVIARANETESVPKLYRAGSEYVLALATVSGRILASNILDEEVISPDTQVDIVRTEAPGLVGMSLVDADVRARTNCTVIAVERGDELLTDIGPDFVVRTDDVLIVAGVDADINRFNELAN
ncbi:Trk K+ transport system, NAD-binding component [Halogranum gelatinilyticum]|uniref:Trk K+ transport system, NAD-binding component n=1 Tax=Halogranum gelatinilyticum TaxID=660521 RepID=A0A1G9REX4_9EURY|nr:NAD-binding protein [Halogranum gelatinilyticum]SDM21852.1 Trk K+ transport system, NAD-binding component [Halogranum gelatinilyticum]